MLIYFIVTPFTNGFPCSLLRKIVLERLLKYLNEKKKKSLIEVTEPNLVSN